MNGAIKSEAVYFAPHNLAKLKLTGDEINQEYNFSYKKNAYYQFVRSLKEKNVDIQFDDYYKKKPLWPYQQYA